jgi:basic membrane lipoprotein Med (substrate-binding protein (PBP1-ABC) superfamily)
MFGKAIAVTAAAGFLALSTLSAQAQVQIEGDPKVAFIYFNVKDDGGWVQAQEEARQKIEASTGWEIPYAEKVEEVASKVRPVIERYIKRGYNIINGSAFGYSDVLLELAAEHPNVAFINAAGTTNNGKNLESYYARTYESQYLCGMVAGAMTKTNKLGFVAAIPLGITVWNVNAWALGAQAVNPDVTVYVTFTNAWYDPVKERATALALVEQGVDILGQHQDTPTTQYVAEEKGLLSTGYHRDMREYTPNTTMCSSVWVWERYLEPTFEKIIAGTWAPSEWGAFPGIKDGGTEVICCSDMVPQEVTDKVMAARDKIVSGELQIFAGPLEKQDGTMAVAAGETVDDAGLWGMNYLVKGIVGQVQ